MRKLGVFASKIRKTEWDHLADEGGVGDRYSPI